MEFAGSKSRSIFKFITEVVAHHASCREVSVCFIHFFVPIIKIIFSSTFSRIFGEHSAGYVSLLHQILSTSLERHEAYRGKESFFLYARGGQTAARGPHAALQLIFAALGPFLLFGKAANL